MLVSAVEKPTVAAAPIALIRMIFGATIVQCIKIFFKLINPTPKRIIKQKSPPKLVQIFPANLFPTKFQFLNKSGDDGSSCVVNSPFYSLLYNRIL